MSEAQRSGTRYVITKDAS